MSSPSGQSPKIAIICTILGALIGSIGTILAPVVTIQFTDHQLRKKLEELQASNGQLDSMVNDLRAENSGLEQTIQDLERQITRGNSPTPSSQSSPYIYFSSVPYQETDDKCSSFAERAVSRIIPSPSVKGDKVTGVIDNEKVLVVCSNKIISIVVASNSRSSLERVASDLRGELGL